MLRKRFVVGAKREEKRKEERGDGKFWRQKRGALLGRLARPAWPPTRSTHFLLPAATGRTFVGGTHAAATVAKLIASLKGLAHSSILLNGYMAE